MFRCWHIKDGTKWSPYCRQYLQCICQKKSSTFDDLEQVNNAMWCHLFRVIYSALNVAPSRVILQTQTHQWQSRTKRKSEPYVHQAKMNNFAWLSYRVIKTPSLAPRFNSELLSARSWINLSSDLRKGCVSYNQFIVSRSALCGITLLSTTVT